jgi:UDP-N-acetylmuramate--alanine ligase
MYNKKTHIHFVGIGGIGMSGIATILQFQGYTISGCDCDVFQKSTQALQKIGCSVYQGNNTAQCHDESIDILVYSSAIKPDNPEIIAAQNRGVPTIPRAVMLAELMRSKYSIAISGAHGKTTTTSMIGHILIEAEHDPTVVIGGHLQNISTNARFGNGDFIVAEADESDKSLLRLHPTIALLTNVDKEHLDIYKDIEDMKDTFQQFLHNIPFYGKAILCLDDKHIQSLLPIHFVKTITYGTHADADFMAMNINDTAASSTFTVYNNPDKKELGAITLSMPGTHNVLNALGAITIAHDLNIPFTTIRSALEKFHGIDRRFTYKGTYRSADIFDDYGHHPTEITVTLNTAAKKTKNKLHVIFQPHKYSRTKHLWQEFIDAFGITPFDTLIITDTHPANESYDPLFDSKQLVTALQHAYPSKHILHIPFNDTYIEIMNELNNNIQPDDLILTLGAGKITKLASYLSAQQ